MIGFDVSRWQGSIGWRRLRKEHPTLRFVYVRAAGGWQGEPESWKLSDPYAVDNLDAANGLGLVVGAYLPLDPTAYGPEEAAVSAMSYLTAVGAFAPGHLVPALDIEDPSADWTPWTREMLVHWRRLTGRACEDRVVLYSAGAYFGTLLHPEVFDDLGLRVGLWVADHNRTPGRLDVDVGGRAVFHQYRTDAELAGITGDVALDAVVEGVALTEWMIAA